MTIQEALKYTLEKLKDQIKNPHFEAELLLSEAIAKERIFVLSHPEYILDISEEEKLNDYISKRNDDTPLAYITHNKSFYNLDFYVDQNTLIPRPETELMVDEVLEIVDKEKNNYDQLNIIDLGTGSGCIITSIAKNIINKTVLKNKVSFFASDISKQALKVAKINAKTHELDKIINFQHKDLLDPIRKFVTDSRIREGQLIIITANLPYLTKEQIETSRSIKKEPKLALDGGKDGMELYIELFKQINELKNISHVGITLLVEIDHTQKDIFEFECKKIFVDSKIKTIKDLGGYERLLIVNC